MCSSLLPKATVCLVCYPYTSQQWRQNKTPKKKKEVERKEKMEGYSSIFTWFFTKIQIRKHKWANPLLLLIGHHTFISTLMQGSLKSRTSETNGQEEKETEAVKITILSKDTEP